MTLVYPLKRLKNGDKVGVLIRLYKLTMVEQQQYTHTTLRSWPDFRSQRATPLFLRDVSHSGVHGNQEDGACHALAGIVVLTDHVL